MFTKFIKIISACARGDCLRLIQVINEDPANNWIIAENVHGKRGIVPSRYVTMLIKEYHEITKGFDNKKSKAPFSDDSNSILKKPFKISLSDCQRSMSISHSSSQMPGNLVSDKMKVRPPVPRKPDFLVKKSIDKNTRPGNNFF